MFGDMKFPWFFYVFWGVAIFGPPVLAGLFLGWLLWA